ncbi:MAG: 2-phosphosulfolactate phosphatase [Isosphaeraceae bacterium]
MTNRPTVSVHLLPSQIPPGALQGGVAVVVDVLRATTTMVHALAAGCLAVIPCLEIEDARRIAASQPPGSTLLAGERQGLPIEGFDLSNSPADFTAEACAGKTLVFTTTNGTRALLACQEAERVVVASFVNLSATARLLREDGRPVHIVCSGTDGFISFEDSLLAGALAEELWNKFDLGGNDAAMLTLTSWCDIDSHDDDDHGGEDVLLNYLTRGRGGRRLRGLGLSGDISDAAAVNRFDLAAELLRDPLRVVLSPTTGESARKLG